jgi:hypothetical protein
MDLSGRAKFNIRHLFQDPSDLFGYRKLMFQIIRLDQAKRVYRSE